MLRLIILVENFTIGGAQRMVYEEIKCLDQDNIALLVICYQSRRNTELERSVEQHARVVYLNIDGHVKLKDFQKVFRTINAFKPDIVHTHLSGQVFAIPWSLLYRKPIVITAHTRPNMAFIKKTEKLLKIGLRRGKIFVVAVSEENHKLILEYFKGVTDKISYINNGVSLSSYRKQEHEFFTYINVARQDENKNQRLIIDCFERIHKRYPQTRLLLVGDGPTHQALKDQVVGLNLQDSVELPGNVSNVEDYYAVADAYLQSSHREAMPMSVLEAMATRLPIISTDVGGMKDVVINNGILIPDNDTEGFERAMLCMFEMNESARKQLGENSFSIVQNYSSEFMTEEYVKLYERIKE